ncbi:MFS general substrate transporter [Gloeophyllum trabeum ATCC 11539]|uniref:MFS general substrate transporter n=1 Tax=Gloeophyllum trabeum (strain ATCC 11539 / FP-39264 / Madison 617) TaxID=670483 RepID=S7PWW7_GLOTA|nr:MFS general substrate transporter [Gloeophyllum trabeum ATCC 11539]EPQ52111.1 MFS general substrate transporter [Gloeophyllum trabeum ATCC 11539]
MYDLTPVPSVLTPSVRSAGEVEYSRKYVRNGWIHFAALCWCFFLQGWNDGTTGPLIPAIQEHYHVGFAVVSLIFVTNCIGYLSGAFANVILNDKLGFGKVVVLGSVCQIVTYAIQAPAPPFPVLVCAYAIAGFGISLQNAQANGFVGSLKDHVAAKLCILHGSYGVGAFAAPLVATHFSQTRHWSFHFLISIGIALTNTIVLTSVFRLKTQDEVMAEAGHGPGEVGGSAQSNLYREILGLKALHFMAIFSLIYVGVEVTLGGWIVTYIIQKRHGGPSSGYISSGFFGGLTVGRIALIWINRKVGERRIIFIYAALAIGLEVTIWLVPNLYENAVAVSFIGLLLGPMYPILVDHATKILPRWLLTGCVGWIAGFGQAGSAVLPFITGVLSAKYGIGSLQPFMVAMMATMIGLWAVVPKAQRRVD